MVGSSTSGRRPTPPTTSWIPERKLLFSGDLTFKGGTPFVLQGSAAGWLDTLQQLKELDVETVVPGQPGGRPRGVRLGRGVPHVPPGDGPTGIEAGPEPLELAQETDLGEFAGLSDHERIVGNLHRAYSELRGEERGTPLDLPNIIREMRTYLGGLIVSNA